MIPFLQIWQEMVHTYTLDVYQNRVLNSLTALVELEMVLQKTLDGLYTTSYNIDSCRLETLQIIKCDHVLLKYEKSIINRLKWNLAKKAEKSIEQKSLRFQVSYAIKKIKPKYLDYVLIELYNSIHKKDFKLMTECTNTIISQCISNGWSAKALFDLNRFFKNSNSLDEKWRSFRDEIIGNKKISHDTLIQLNSIDNESIEKLMSIGIDVKTYEELVIQYEHISDISRLLKKEKKYIHHSVEAKDIYSAAHIAIKDLSKKMNFASFYNLISIWDIKSLLVIVINTMNLYHKPIKSDELYQTYDYLDSSGNIFESTRKIIFEHESQQLKSKLHGAFAYANISRASVVQEEKYMNLWVAIESISRLDIYNDIISSLKTVLPAALCTRYIYRIIRNFVEDCIRCGITYNFTEVEIDMKQDSKRNLVRETIDILQTNHLYLELLDKCKVNTMMKFRCEDVMLLVNDIDYAFKKIQNHHDKVEWHIQRLYRIRNEIAHSALQEESYLNTLTEHMYDYLSVFILEIVTSVEGRKLSSLGEVHTLIKDNYDLLVEYSKSKEHQDHQIIKDTVLKTGIIDFLFFN